ncbi:MAG TPA: S9 family peptidase [Glaciihabitans sp.]|jgi:dipeptidyl aminopeptidase/acylaminoacyl peptidase|nr:S9 family peptidase [Glaciihabitans sp.]
MQATDIGLLSSVSAPTLSPDASRAVFAVATPNLRADATVGQLWAVPVDGSAPATRLTRGFRDSAPQFSPDGALIAFVRSTASTPPQLHLVSATGGEPVAVTDMPLGVGQFCFSPSGDRLAFVARVPEEGRYGTVDGRGPAAEQPRRITTLKYKSNGLGFTVDRPAQLFVITVPPVDAEPIYEAAPEADGRADEIAPVPEPQQLTFGEADVSAPEWSRSSDHVLVVSARHADRDTTLLSDLYEVALNGATEPRALTSGQNLGVASGIRTADGTLWVLAQDLGPSGGDFVAATTGLYVQVPSGSLVRLTDASTIDLSESDITVVDTAVGAGEQTVDSVLVRTRTRGTVQLVQVTSAGEVTPLTAGNIEVIGAASVGTSIVVGLVTETSAGEIAVVDSGGLRVLTDFGSGIRAAGVLPNRELIATARDGSEIHGWVVLPEGEGPHPVLLTIHGGPFAQYTSTLFDEMQVYANAGYAVVFCNPRGSAGYGTDHGRSIRQAMGTVDYTDVLDFFEAAVAAYPSIDGTRAGVQGGSYGGYLTAWIIANDHRFSAAIVERGFLDPESFEGTSDIGSFFGHEYTGTDPDLIRSQSPQARVAQVRTPTFVVHSADDLRCPLGQAERYFATLRRAGVEAEMLIFPGENHELTRSGRPRHRVQRFNAVLEWWAKYLPVQR